jgi:hypothetical protein
MCKVTRIPLADRIKSADAEPALEGTNWLKLCRGGSVRVPGAVLLLTGAAAMQSGIPLLPGAWPHGYALP